MISTVKKEIAISKELHSKIEWACTFSNCEPKIKNGNLRMIEKTNLAYVEPHTAVIKDKIYLFFNEHEYPRLSHRAGPRAHVVGVDPRLERQGSAGKTGSSGMD